MTSLISLSLLLMVSVAVFWSHEADAVCCGHDCVSECERWSSYCHDCTSDGWYCGVGGCNIFGCNCDGGCLKGIGCWNCGCPIVYGALDHSHPPVSELSDEEYKARSEEHLNRVFSEADQDKDGRISRAEYERWAAQYHPVASSKQGTFDVQDQFKKMDKDRSGYLTKEEIDPK